MGHILLQTIRWLMAWLYYVCIICFAGTLLGVLTHLAYGLLFAENPDYGFLIAFGFSNGLQYGGVWAGGFAIVLCVMRAHKQHITKHS